MAGIRQVGERDLAAVAGLVRALAEYERVPLPCWPRSGQLRRALFGPQPALFGHVAEVCSEVVGCALWLPDLSLGKAGPGIYLEDLYVRPDHRGRGLGRGLLAALALEGCRRGSAWVRWSVQGWNENAYGFYRSLGATPQDDPTMWWIGGQALARLAGSAPGLQEGHVSGTWPR